MTAFNQLDFNPALDWMKKRKELLKEFSVKIVDKYIHFSYNRCDRTTSMDKVQEYLGCFYAELNDAIKEADGESILRCWRYLLLPIVWKSGQKNYATEVFQMLCQYDFMLSPAHTVTLCRC